MNPSTSLAIGIVRAWTRLYTGGLPPGQRTARQAEIDSDLWELAHDPRVLERGNAATQIVTRLLAGIPDDLAWRLEIGAMGNAVPARALAAAGMITGPRRISALGLSATIHVIGISAVVWLTSHGLLYWRNPNAVAPSQQADMWEQFDIYETGADSLKVPEANAPTTQPNKFIAILLQNRYSLEVRDGDLLGTGAPMLQSAIRDSRFVVLGEDHDLVRTSELGAAICKITQLHCESVLLKVDALEVYRGLNPLRGRGTGNHVAISAERQGLQSLHIRVIAFSGTRRAYPRYLQLFLSKTLKSEWTLFDLRPLRRDFNALAGRSNADLATLVFGIDMLIVVPEGIPVSRSQ